MKRFTKWLTVIPAMILLFGTMTVRADDLDITMDVVKPGDHVSGYEIGLPHDKDGDKHDHPPHHDKDGDKHDHPPHHDKDYDEDDDKDSRDHDRDDRDHDRHDDKDHKTDSSGD